MTTQEIVIRDETKVDVAVITEVTVAAFATIEISNHTEQFIIEALRSARALTLSLVAEKEEYSKACSVNTLYFWPSPRHTAQKIAEILKPNGKLILAFEDIKQLKLRKLNQDVFHLYSKDEVQDLLINAGFSDDVNIVSRVNGDLIFHCVVAKK